MADTCVIRRTKYGKTAFVASVHASGDVERFTPDREQAVKLSEAEATRTLDLLDGRQASGAWAVTDAGGCDIAGFGCDLHHNDIGPPAQGGGIEQPGGEYCVVATADSAGPFPELSHLLGITADPANTTLRDVAAAAAKEITELRELVEMATTTGDDLDPDDDTAPAAAQPPAAA